MTFKVSPGVGFYDTNSTPRNFALELQIVLKELDAYLKWIRKRYHMKPEQKFDVQAMNRLELLTKELGKDLIDV